MEEMDGHVLHVDHYHLKLLVKSESFRINLRENEFSESFEGLQEA